MMKRLKKLPIHLILIGLGFFFLLPFIWMLSTALKSDQQVLVNPPIWIPKPVMWGGSWRRPSESGSTR